MKIKNGLSAEQLEELVYKVICWMKKWGLWDFSTIFSRGKAFSSYHKRADYFGTAERKQSGWRGWEDVWVWGYGLEEMGEDLQDILDCYALAIECGDSLDLLLEQGIYTAEFDSLPDAAQICLLRHMALFESCEQWWHDIYLEEGVCFQDTEFDSFDEYWELESVNQEEFKLELLKQCLRDPRESIGYNGEVAKLVLGELDEILKPYHLQYWADSYCDISLCIGYVVNAEIETDRGAFRRK